MWHRVQQYVSLCRLGVVIFAAAEIWAIAQLAAQSANPASLGYLVLAAICLYPLVACAYRLGCRHQSTSDVTPASRFGAGYQFDDVTGGDYDWKRLIDVYLLATREHIHKDIEEYYRELLRHLEAMFELRVVPPFESAQEIGSRYVFVMLMRSVVRSYHQATTPTAGMLESGLLHSRIEDAGEDGQRVIELLKKIMQGYLDTKAAHVELVQTLFKMIHGEPTKVVTSHELRSQGFDDSKPPRPSDYWEHA
ncbi:MAG: hypothetical protein H6818_09495 [Phycisphaerales bacterium]|nr:hypothetical protein [Phycisphaerales bacterium]MCB9864113.1 hypothetical protein [Phycisphaerales bacterium]